jgi:hypothetical protein
VRPFDSNLLSFIFQGCKAVEQSILADYFFYCYYFYSYESTTSGGSGALHVKDYDVIANFMQRLRSTDKLSSTRAWTFMVPLCPCFTALIAPMNGINKR